MPADPRRLRQSADEAAEAAILQRASCTILAMAPRTLPALLRSASDGGAGLIYGRHRLPYGELEVESRRVAAGLRQLGVGRGDRVALWLPNSPAWLALFFACARLGAIAVAVNTRFREAEVGDIVGRSEARVLVLWPDFHGIDFLGILDGVDRGLLGSLQRVVIYGESGDHVPEVVAGRRTIDYDELRRARASDEIETDEATADLGCVIFTTSGTTRSPKFVLHRQSGLVGHAADVARVFGYGEAGARLAQVLPLCGVFGLCQAMAGLAAGCDNVLFPSFDALQLARCVAHEGVTHLNGADDMFRRLFAAAGSASSLRSLRQCGFAAFSGQPEALVEEGDRRGVPLVGLYGMSEVQAFFAARSALEPPELRCLAGGRPVSAEAAVRVCDPQGGGVLAAGEEGELEVKGPSLMAGYYGDDEATAEALAGDGFLRTGDLGRTDEDGSFTFLSRMGDALRLGGFLVAPAEIEAYIDGHPAVAGAQVVGVGTERGLRPVAFVIPRAGATFDEEALQSHCAAGLAPFKVPVRVIAVEEFPTTEGPNGTKIQRVKLRRMAEELLAAESRREPDR